MLVLGLIAIGLSAGYASLRSQSSTIYLQNNARRQLNARQAAHSGLLRAISQMHASGWSGVGSTVTGSFSPTQSYWVNYLAGDSRLLPGHPDYARYPLRVTIVSTGVDQDPADPRLVSTHRMQAVMELSPQRIPAEPANWNDMQARTVFQWKSADFTVQAPSRVEGKVWVQGRLWLSPSDPSDANVRNRLHADLKTLRDQGTDWRPLDTTVELRPSAQPGGFNNELSRLGLSFSSVGSLTVPNWTGPGAHLQYQLYPGGAVYTTPRIGSLQNTTLAPDPVENPLGIFYSATDITIGDNVAVRGTLIAGRDIFINGRNVSLEAADLPPVAGSVRPLRLPTLLAGDDIVVNHRAAAAVRGVVSAYDEFEVARGDDSTQFDLRGHVICAAFTADGRNEWGLSSFWWRLLELQYLSINNRPTFPEYLQAIGLRPAPQVVLRPGEDDVEYHWKRPADTLYLPLNNNQGLRWILRDWRENVPLN